MEKIENVPFFEDSGIYCLSAVGSMIVNYYEKPLETREIARRIMKKSSDGEKNAYGVDLCGYLSENGFYCEYYANFEDGEAMNTLIKNLEEKCPVIVGQRFSTNDDVVGHARLVTWYDKETETILCHDPNPQNGENYKIKKEEFMELWKKGGNPNMIQEKEMIIVRKKSNLTSEICKKCQKKMIKWNVDHNKIPQGMKFVEIFLQFKSNGVLYHCENCKRIIGVFSPKL